MLDLDFAFEDFVPDIELADSSIDADFITSFLMPYFKDLPREHYPDTLTLSLNRCNFPAI